jgi:hypothetical protein
MEWMRERSVASIALRGNNEMTSACPDKLSAMLNVIVVMLRKLRFLSMFSDATGLWPFQS